MREFYAEGMLWENNPRRLKHRRKPRFRWGICAVCGRETQLERDGCGEYTCFDCFGKAHEKKSYSQRTPAIGALELCCENHFSNRFSGIISDEMLRSVVIALAKTPLNLQDRAILLRLSARLIASGSEDEALQRVCAALYDQMLKENMNDTGDPATAARCILGLLAAKEVL